MSLTQGGGLNHSPLFFDASVPIPEPAKAPFADQSGILAAEFRHHDKTAPTPADLAMASKAFMDAASHLPRLLDITDDKLRLMADFEAAYEQTPPDEAALARIAAEFEDNEALVIAKLENYLALDQKFTMFEQAFKARAAELRELGAIAERNRERLRARLMTAMKTMGRDKIVTPSGIVSVRTNPPAVNVVDPALVPHEFERTKILIDVDKRAILEAFKRTGEIPAGVEITRGERLDVK